MLRSINWSGIEELNTRTGKKCKSLPGLTFQVDLSDHFPLISLRKMSVKNFVAEQLWFLSGSNDTNWLSTKTKIWDSFREKDGTLTAAYGHRWRYAPAEAIKENGDRIGTTFDQLEYVLFKLKMDPSSRHGVVMMWDPWKDLTVIQKNVPCPYTFTLMIIGGKLHLHLTVRSNDMVLGFPTDVAGFALLQLILAQRLNVLPGIYTHSISNAHIYEDHYSAAEQMTKLSYSGEFPKIKIDLPENAYNRSKELDETLYRSIIDSVERQYKPLAAIPGLVVSV